MKNEANRIPRSEFHRGIRIHAGQDPARVEVVKREIDATLAMQDIGEVAEVAEDVGKPPEVRLLACALVEALWAQAADERRPRPDVDIEMVRACVIGLDDVTCRNPYSYSSIYDGIDERAVPRPEPLA
jgi:hypothetical protein